jgi:hypothetical protein
MIVSTFERKIGTVTAGNSCPITDGAGGIESMTDVPFLWNQKAAVQAGITGNPLMKTAPNRSCQPIPRAASPNAISVVRSGIPNIRNNLFFDIRDRKVCDLKFNPLIHSPLEPNNAPDLTTVMMTSHPSVTRDIPPRVISISK